MSIGLPYFSADAASASHSAADTAVPGVEDHRHLRFRENFVKRIDGSVVCLELLDRWVQLESANTTCGDQATRLVRQLSGPRVGSTLANAMILVAVFRRDFRHAIVRQLFAALNRSSTENTRAGRLAFAVMCSAIPASLGSSLPTLKYL